MRAFLTFLVTRIPLLSGLNIAAWRSRLTRYHNTRVADLMEFCFPANYSADTPPVPTYCNHQEAGDHSRHLVTWRCGMVPSSASSQCSLHPLGPSLACDDETKGRTWKKEGHS